MSFTGDLTLSDRATMAMRATYLITIFLPFILLGNVLLGLADLLLRWSVGSRVHINGHRWALASWGVLQRGNPRKLFVLSMQGIGISLPCGDVEPGLPL